MNISCDVIPILFMILILVVEFYKKIEIFFMRKNGDIPKKGYETIVDVENLIKNNKKHMAIVCYQLIDTQISWKLAEKEVEKIASKLRK